jgi:predicted dehydrogenase
VTVRIGQAGLGEWGKNLARNFAELAELSWLSDPAEGKDEEFQARYPQARWAASLDEMLGDPELDAVVLATPVPTHYELAKRVLEAGKHVFVEKPLAIDEDELREVELAVAGSPGTLVVGFNRRFAPLAVKLRAALGDHGPLMIVYRVNAGRLPRSHWTHDPEVGGGRIAGEVCHFVDFAGWLVGDTPREVAASAVAGSSEPRDDNLAATLRYPDGSVAVVVYSALGDKGLRKERIEVLGEAGAGVLDDFRDLSLHLGGKTSESSQRRQDKGHAAELAAFLDGCRTGEQPWPTDEMTAVMRATFEIRDQLRGRDLSR